HWPNVTPSTHARMAVTAASLTSATWVSFWRPEVTGLSRVVIGNSQRQSLVSEESLGAGLPTRGDYGQLERTMGSGFMIAKESCNAQASTSFMISSQRTSGVGQGN
ncbi:hypothetical protein EV702DRAFT_1046505, partial [Suillus placidus]